MDLDLGARGLVGLLTPRENPTAEPEAAVLLPPDVAMLTARMQSASPSMAQRLADYADDLPLWMGAFGQAPLDAVGFACTGASYLIGEPLPCHVRHAGRAIPFVTAAAAVEAALHGLGARTVAVVNPYPDDLTRSAIAYWSGRGFSIVAVVPMRPAVGYHPIYGQDNGAALAAITAASGSRADAVLALGTGAPTLAALAVALEAEGPPLLSSNLCLGWRLACVLGGDEPLSAWLRPQAAWIRRLADRFPTALTRLKAPGDHP
jgi:maleate isomerase